MPNSNNKILDSLTSKNIVYILLIAILCISLCVYDLSWIIPSIIIFALTVSYTFWSSGKKKTELENHIQDITSDVTTASKGNLINTPIPLVLIETDGNIVWRSKKFVEEFQNIDIATNLNPIVKEIKLEGNYRSGKSILSIANRLIENNTYRRGKTLEASADKQSEVKKYEFYNDLEEASFTAKTILDKHDDGISYDDMAILYRTNAQSLNFERALKMANIPHKVIGNIGFYQRREVKDILAYLKFSDNPKDEQAFFRSISVPKRGIGNSTNDKIISYAEENDITILETLETDLKFLSKSRAAVDRYIQLIHDIIKCESIRDKIELILNTIKYKEYLQSLGEEPDIIDRKMENIDELISDAVRFEEQNGSSLSDFLASAALVSSNDEEDIEGSVKLMTMHAAKGLEFKLVFLTGLEEGLFPLGNEDGEANIEEERRLCYVGVTRAMETLYITRARSRIRGGRHNQSPESRFLSELQFGRSFKFNKGSTNNTFKNRSGNYADYIKNSSNYEKKEYNDDNTASFKASSKVYHSVFGEGTVLFSEGSGENEKVTVHFKKEGVKKIIANFLEKA